MVEVHPVAEEELAEQRAAQRLSLYVFQAPRRFFKSNRSRNPIATPEFSLHEERKICWLPRT